MSSGVSPVSSVQAAIRAVPNSKAAIAVLKAFADTNPEAKRALDELRGSL